MIKRCISFLIIFSMVWIDVARAMDEEPNDRSSSHIGVSQRLLQDTNDETLEWNKVIADFQELLQVSNAFLARTRRDKTADTLPNIANNPTKVGSSVIPPESKLSSSSKKSSHSSSGGAEIGTPSSTRSPASSLVGSAELNCDDADGATSSGSDDANKGADASLPNTEHQILNTASGSPPSASNSIEEHVTSSGSSASPHGSKHSSGLSEDGDDDALPHRTPEQLMEDFLKPIAEKDALKPPPPHNSASINHDQDGEKTRLLPKSGDVEGGRHSKTPLLSKAEFLRDWLKEIFAKNPEKVKEYFKEWLTDVERNPDDLPHQIILELLEKHQKFMPTFFMDEFQRLARNDAVRTLTVQNWLESMGFCEIDPRHKGKGKALPEGFNTLAREVIHYDLAHRLLMDQSKDMDPRVKAFLAYFQEETVEGHLTKKQWAMGVLGIITAAGASQALGTIFIVGMDAFFDKIGLGAVFDGTTDFSMSVFWFTACTSFLDSVPRDWEYSIKLVAPSKMKFLYSSKNKVSKTLKTCAQVLAGATLAGLTAYYFFSDEYNGIIWAKDHPQYYYGQEQEELIEEIWDYFFSYAPCLVVDAAVAAFLQLNVTGEVLTKKWEKLKHYFQGTFMGEIPLLRNVLKNRLLSPEEIQRNEFVETLRILKRKIFLLNKSAINEVYEEVYHPLLKTKKTTKINNNYNELTIQESFINLIYVKRLIEEQVESHKIEEDHKSCVSKDGFSVGFGSFVALAATYARYLAYQYAGNYLFSSFGIENETTLSILSNLFAVMGSIPQGFMEEMAVEENTKSLLGEKEESQTSHSTTRKIVNTISGLLGIYYTLPYLVTGWLALQSDSLLMQIFCLTPYLFADSNSNTWSLKDTYGSYIHGYDWLKSKLCAKCCEGVSSDYKRDRLMQWFDGLTELAQEACPFVIARLSEMLNKDEFEGKKTKSIAGEMQELVLVEHSIE